MIYIIAPTLTGLVVQYGGGYNVAFVISAAVCGVGMAVVVLAVKGVNHRTAVALTHQAPLPD